MRAAALLLALILPLRVLAQDASPPALPDSSAPAPERLADLRASLGQLSAGLQALRAELVASGAEGFQAAGGDTAIDRMTAMEAEIARLTGRIEALEHRITRLVRDGTNRIGDIEFRLCELDPLCDLGALTTAQMDAGVAGAGGAAGGLDLSPSVSPEPESTPAFPNEAAASAWAAAEEALAVGDAAGAAAQFEAIADAHAGTPLAAEAIYQRGAALDAGGEAAAAAQAWLQSFSAAPGGARAPDALLGIARVLADQGKTADACVFLDDLTARFGGSAAAAEAQERIAALGCATQAPPPASDESEMDPEAAADAAEHGG